MKLALSVAFLAATFAPFAHSQTPAVKVETGTLDGAPYRIDMPAKWNGILLVYYHGYAEHPAHFDKDQPDPIGTGFAAAGFAVAQSGYSQVGWALERALPETEALRQYTIAQYGQPKETYVTGHSMGGLLTAATIESYPNRYDGALALCGLLQPTTWALGRGGAMLAAFDFYYPGLLPGPVNIPASASLDEDLVATVLKALPSSPKGHAEMMALGHYKTDLDLASGVVFGTWVQREIEQRIGASALDNHNFIYAGGPDDNALNDGVKRYTASEAALAYLKTWYTPTGVLLKPMLAVHTTYDPIIPAETVALYADTVQRAGSSRNFVQQYVKADGHCHISGPETAVALEELIKWKHTGVKPEGGPVPAAK
ncbi:alpha/beta fold hydrolase [Acidicapsa ligni]|uniref:prolyl oligopeptidase family serine peptidase n=1 Tax=Acidicapsa ligni TaxID=542300 RepID=UPI0021E0EF36|nr:prolyl oligopeptidase family serine peptidase [Acidicapsa ligni]